MIEVTEESASHSKIAMASNMDIFINEDDDTIDKTDISYIWRSSSILVLLMYTLCPKCQKIKNAMEVILHINIFIQLYFT